MSLGVLASTAYKLAFEKSPIFLTGGIAQSIKGGTLPIIALTQGMSILTAAVYWGFDQELLRR